jgi:glutamine amidotransferase
MKKSVVIVDTGCANLTSVKYACERLGYRAHVTQQADAISAADRVILPGVGHAAYAMRHLAKRQLIPVICALKQPVLGICLGMQLLAQWTAEGNTKALGIISTKVTRLPDTARLPHMGWNRVHFNHEHGGLFSGIAQDSYFYFVHSYAVSVGTWTIGQSHYAINFSAAVRRGNFFGVQFHPEKSSKTGHQLLRNFLEIQT